MVVLYSTPFLQYFRDLTSLYPFLRWKDFEWKHETTSNEPEFPQPCKSGRIWMGWLEIPLFDLKESTGRVKTSWSIGNFEFKKKKSQENPLCQLGPFEWDTPHPLVEWNISNGGCFSCQSANPPSPQTFRKCQKGP